MSYRNASAAMAGLMAVVLITSLATAGRADNICGTTFLTNADGTWENGYTWAQWWHSDESDIGAFAECFSGSGEVCAVHCWLTDTGAMWWDAIDIFVWADDGGRPGSILSVTLNIETTPSPVWPAVTEYALPLAQPCCVDGTWWAGYRGDYVNQFIAADLDGPGPGCPMTSVPPGVGLPEGWQPVPDVLGPVQALGIGAEIRDCLATPVRPETWGRVKSLFRN